MQSSKLFAGRSAALVVFLGLMVLGAVQADDASGEKYPDKFDHIRASDILGNERLREQYYKCFAQIGPCVTADAKFFYHIFPEAVVTQCRKCTERQKQSFEEIVDWYTKNQPDKWEAIVATAIKDVQARAKKNSAGAKRG